MPALRVAMVLALLEFPYLHFLRLEVAEIVVGPLASLKDLKPQ